MTSPNSSVVGSSAVQPARPSNDPGTEVIEEGSDTPAAPMSDPSRIAAIVDAIAHSEFRAAAREVEALGGTPNALGAAAAEVEAAVLAKVRPIPGSNLEANLAGYELLAMIAPENPTYTAKAADYRDRIEAGRTAAITRLNPTDDRIEGITWFQHPNEPRYLNTRSTAYLYIGRRGEEGRPFLRMKVTYTAREWLFVSNVIAWADGERMPFVSARFERDNNSTIWEWVDVAPNVSQIAALMALAEAKEAILRFEGAQYRRDVTLGAGDKKAIREVLEAFAVMSE